MKFKQLLSVSAVAGMLSIVGCGGGDITINEGDEVVVDPGNGGGNGGGSTGFECPKFCD